jgi:HTH-type transcriptional regulator/antitoxin HipB
MGKNVALAKAFGETLRELRAAACLSQSQLGGRVVPAMEPQAIARYEAGGSVPTLDVLNRLADALGVDPCALIPRKVKKAKK